MKKIQNRTFFLKIISTIFAWLIFNLDLIIKNQDLLIVSKIVILLLGISITIISLVNSIKKNLTNKDLDKSYKIILIVLVIISIIIGIILFTLINNKNL